ncbi:AMIN-like domain-containing (lipo)protein [Kribbella sp. CA-253562]|uniref:AMIN-like domain-containing (lipo)protein n=1 Tax=Kribbella sp. CA-253562 TaxID=3239942 RepID=UPI003D8A2FBE
MHSIHTTTTCPTGWGSLPEANTFVTAGILTTVRSGRHACFDRVVFDVSGTTPGYSVRYVSNVFRPGAGHLMPLRGGAKLQIVLRVNEFDDAGHWAYQPSDAFRQKAYRTRQYGTWRCSSSSNCAR